MESVSGSGPHPRTSKWAWTQFAPVCGSGPGPRTIRTSEPQTHAGKLRLPAADLHCYWDLLLVWILDPGSCRRCEQTPSEQRHGLFEEVVVIHISCSLCSCFLVFRQLCSSMFLVANDASLSALGHKKVTTTTYVRRVEHVQKLRFFGLHAHFLLSVTRRSPASFLTQSLVWLLDLKTSRGRRCQIFPRNHFMWRASRLLPGPVCSFPMTCFLTRFPVRFQPLPGSRAAPRASEPPLHI